MNHAKGRGNIFLSAALLALSLVGAPVSCFASVFVSVAIAPPILPVYAQPVVPGRGYVWTPGYWAYGAEGYFWVPGTWVLAPFTGALWTPGYWAWTNRGYGWHAGYWGPHVGFYGGINYGFGYYGIGYRGGYWSNGAFRYNNAVTNVNVTNVHNAYNEAVANSATVSRVSYNGGSGGIATQPIGGERLAERDQHRAATLAQEQHERVASVDRAQLASVNHGTPALAATPRAASFKDRGAVTAQGAATQRTMLAGATPGRSASQVTRADALRPRAHLNVAHGPSEKSEGQHAR
jgi:WXXGXW repeat (2 copies)